MTEVLSDKIITIKSHDKLHGAIYLLSPNLV